MEYFYIKHSTEKAYLVMDGRGYYWIPKVYGTIHPKYPFLVKIPNAFRINYTEEFSDWKKWKRQQISHISVSLIEVASCRFNEHTVEGESFNLSDTFIPIDEKTASCPICGSGLKNIFPKLIIYSDVENIIKGRVMDFLKSFHLKDGELFESIPLPAQLKILDIQMKEYGGYYSDGLGLMWEERVHLLNK